jgi:RNA polymerase sigma-70 factor (ECF subfamily)
VPDVQLQNEPNDAALLASVASGDRAALSALVQRHWASLFRYTRRMTGDEAAAEDALQDTFLAVLEHAATFRGEGSARAWLYTLARNSLRRRARRRVGEPSPAELSEDVESLGASAGFGCVSHWTRSLEDRQEIERALAGLSDDDREVLALVDAEGLSIEEASSSLGLSDAALKSRLHRARLRFMAAMRAMGGES